jgi:hypothetical protein
MGKSRWSIRWLLLFLGYQLGEQNMSSRALKLTLAAAALGGVLIVVATTEERDPLPTVADPPPTIPQPASPVETAPSEANPPETTLPPWEKEPAAPVGEFSEATPRGVAVKTTQDTFAAPNRTLLTDVLSYAAQGDQSAVANMVAEPFPKAYAFPAGSQLVFEGCGLPTDTCPFVEARELGSDRKLLFKTEDLTVDGR